MVVTIKTCVDCGEDFEAQRSTAKYCSERCGRRARRKSAGETADGAQSPAENDPDEKPKGSNRGGRSASTDGTGEKSPLVAAVRKELRAKGRLDSVDGQIAVILAKQASAANASGVSSLMKELRVVVDRALEGTEPTSAAGMGAKSKTVEDEITKARKRRERKARQAADRA